MKSWECAKALVHHLNAFSGLFAVICRETENSLKHSAQKLMWDTICRLELQHQFRNMVGEIRHVSNSSFVIFKGIGRDPDSIKSMEGADIVWVEEAQTISKTSLEILIPTITRKTGAEIWFTYNPRFRTDAVSQMFDSGHPLAFVESISYTENPHLSISFVAEAEELRKRNPSMYNHVYGGEYLDECNLKMVSKIVVDDGVQNRINDITVVGVDIARDGGDRTTIYVRRGRKIVERRRFDVMDLDKLIVEMQEINRIYAPDRINVDSTGHGAWVPDALRKLGIKNVHGINFSESAWDEDKYANKRTNLYGLADDYFAAGGTVPDDPELQEELGATWYTYDTKNRPQLVPKAEIKKKIGRSTDDSDGFCLCLYTGSDDMFTRKSVMATRVSSELLAHEMLSNSGWG